MDERQEFLHWFSGFVAGEGCFSINKIRARETFQCRLSINLRDDDLPILLEIQETLRMGTIQRQKRRGNRCPCALWSVNRIADILRLVNIFDQYPLRAKKQRDYEIWREAALEISRGQGNKGNVPVTYDRRRLSYLRQKLSLVRSYDPDDDDIEEFNPSGEQLELALYIKEQ